MSLLALQTLWILSPNFVIAYVYHGQARGLVFFVNGSLVLQAKKLDIQVQHF